MATVLVLVSSSLHAEDESYHRRFSELLSQGTRGFISDISLVDTNNFGPVLTNGAVPFSPFSQKGELAGIKLGMSMAEIVKAWGRPRFLFTHCQIGPRFNYGQRASLFFRGDRLVLIAIDSRLVGQVVFDNGLNGTMGRKQVEGLLGTPSLRIAQQSRMYEAILPMSWALSAQISGSALFHWHNRR